MDPVTHFMTGAVLSRAGFNRKTAYATLAMTLAAEAPDLDVLWSIKGPVASFQHHRGWTHTLLGVPFEAVVVVGFIWLVHRWRLRRNPAPTTAAPLRWPLLYLFSLIALLSHILLDWTNNYGVRPFFPFNPRWYAGGFVFIAEPVIWVLLFAALIIPGILGLAEREISSRRTSAPFRGRGMEFDQVVKYEFGDDVRDIDWNVTARRGEPYRKKYVEERELTLVLLFDDSLSLQFGSGQRSKRASVLELAGLLALLSAGNRDRAGFWHATPDTHLVREPVRGRTAIIETAARLFAQPVPDLDRGGDVEIDWQRFFHAFPRHSVVLWLGDFAPRPLPRAWAALRRRYQMVGLRVEDAWERVLPARGRITAVDPSTGELVPFDPGSRASRARHAMWVRARDAYFKQLFPSPLDCPPPRRMLLSTVIWCVSVRSVGALVSPMRTAPQPRS